MGIILSLAFLLIVVLLLFILFIIFAIRVRTLAENIERLAMNIKKGERE